MIYTFYSYKGGVGRSMGLANIAEWYYLQGLRVVMIDWDLEAPGLENFFYDDPEQIETIRSQLGIIDLLTSYKRAFPRLPLSATLSGQDDDASTLGKDFDVLDDNLPPIAHSLYPIHPQAPGSNSGSLLLLPAGWRAGDRFPIYARAVQSFDWAEFYTSFRGYLYFEWMRRQLIATELADVVLIDSRTGVTEMGGVCTRHLADVVVSMAAPNTQNLDGVARMAASFTREISDRKGRPLQVVMVPARIDTGEKDRRNRFESEFRQKLDEFTPATYKTVHTDFWQLRIPYIGAYAYEETLAIGRPDRDKDLEEAYKKVAAHLAILAPGKSALRQKSSVELERIFGKQLPRVFISSEGDQSESLAARLRARFEENGVSVWPTAPNPAAALSMLEQIKFLLLVLTSESKNSGALISEYRVARQQGLDVLLISASGEFQPSPLMRNQPLYDADRDWDLILRTVQEPPKNVRVPFMAAGVLPRYVSLENELARLKSEVLSGENSGNNFVLWGPIGSGKTTLTIQLCNDDDVISAFDGGILWVDLDSYPGQPDIKAQIARLIVALTGDRSVTFVDDTDAAAYLTEKLGQRKCLMVIDEASDSRQVQPFLRGAPNCVRLITTRDSALAPAIGAKLIAIGDVSEDEAFKILAAQIKLSDEETHSLQRLVARLGRLPLVLKLANAQLKHRLELGGTVQSAVDEFERALQSANLLAFDVPGTNARDESASLSISASLAQLNDGERLRYLKLGYFPEHLAITAPEAARLWGEKEYDAERLLRRFADMSLLQRDSTGAGFTLHPLLRSYILHEGGNQLGVDTKFEAAFAHLTEEEQQNARAIFTRLVRVARSNEGEDVAVKANTSVFNTNAPSILARLTEAGLIVASPQGDVEFADETAVKEWRRLRGWIDQDREFLLWRDYLKNGIDTWERLSLDDEELLSGASLSQALEWRKRNPAALNERELRFIEASERRQKELRPTPLVEPLPSRATRRRAPVVLVVIGVAALLSIGWFALFNRSKESTPPGQSSPAPKISQQTLADSLIDSGKLDMEKGAYDSALTKFSSALELQPASTAALMNRASAYSKLGKTDESIADYSKLLATDPENADAYNFRGSGYLKAKQYDKAIADFSQALRRKNRLIDAYLGRAAAYRSKGDTGKAYADLTTARLLSSDPKTLATIDRSLTEIEAARLRIIPHYSSPSEEKLAQAIATALRGQGYRVDKPQEISTSSPSGIRYFFQEDKKRAEELSVIIPNLIKDRRIQGLHVIYIQTQATVDRGTIEIWLPAGPGFKQY